MRQRNYYRLWTQELQDRLAQLWCLDGLTYEEIGAELGFTAIAIKNQITILGLCLTPQAIQIRRGRGIHRGPTTPAKGTHMLKIALVLTLIASPAFAQGYNPRYQFYNGPDGNGMSTTYPNGNSFGTYTDHDTGQTTSCFTTHYGNMASTNCN